jgi:hypothetical protein
MHTANELLYSLQKQGVHLWMEGEQLRYRYPKGARLQKEIEELRERRSEIVELLKIGRSTSEFPIPLEPRIISAQVPLTAMQRRPDFYADKPHPRTMSFALRISGSLDIEIIRKSVSLLVCRHESLRTRINTKNNPPIQHFGPSEGCHVGLVDLTSTGEMTKPLTQPLIQDFIGQYIDPAIGPLFECRVFRLAYEEYVLVMSVDHVISDNISCWIFWDELWTLYEQAMKGQPMFLPPTLLQFGDYAVWLSKIYPCWQEINGSYWTQRFTSAPRMQWPLDCHQDKVTRAKFDSLKISIPKVPTANLETLARGEGVPMSLTVLALYVVTLSKWSSQYDLTLTLVDTGRHGSHLFRMVGLLVDFLYLRFQLERNFTFLDVLYLAKQEFNSASSHRDFDWMPSMIPELREELFFNWLSGNDGKVAPFERMNGPSGLKVEPIPPPELSNDAISFFERELVSPCKIAFAGGLSGGELSFTLHFRADLFSSESIGRIERIFRTTLWTVIQQPTLPCFSSPI